MPLFYQQENISKSIKTIIQFSFLIIINMFAFGQMQYIQLIVEDSIHNKNTQRIHISDWKPNISQGNTKQAKQNRSTD
jgi:meiotically up-regulated gene 157 (Mug157) protein